MPNAYDRETDHLQFDPNTFDLTTPEGRRDAAFAWGAEVHAEWLATATPEEVERAERENRRQWKLQQARNAVNRERVLAHRRSLCASSRRGSITAPLQDDVSGGTFCTVRHCSGSVRRGRRHVARSRARSPGRPGRPPSEEPHDLAAAGGLA